MSAGESLDERATEPGGPSFPSPLRRSPEPGGGPVPIVPIEDAIDLHGFQPRDIPSVVEEYVRAAAEQGFQEVRLIATPICSPAGHRTVALPGGGAVRRTTQ